MRHCNRMLSLLLALLLALCMIVGLLPIAAVAAGEALPAQYTLRFGSSAYTLTKYDTPIYFLYAPKETHRNEDKS